MPLDTEQPVSEAGSASAIDPTIASASRRANSFFIAEIILSLILLSFDAL